MDQLNNNQVRNRGENFDNRTFLWKKEPEEDFRVLFIQRMKIQRFIF